MSTLTLQLPEELARQLEAIGKEQGTTAEDAAADMLSRAVAVRAFRAARQAILAKLGDEAPKSESDIFEQIS